MFQVLECTWDKLLQQVLEATDLDELLSAHHDFLSTIIARCLLDDQSCVSKIMQFTISRVIIYNFENIFSLFWQDILTQLRTIFDLIIKFQTIQDDMYQSACFEQEARERYERKIKQNTEQVTFSWDIGKLVSKMKLLFMLNHDILVNELNYVMVLVFECK